LSGSITEKYVKVEILGKSQRHFTEVSGNKHHFVRRFLQASATCGSDKCSVEVKALGRTGAAEF
jgi:hypothetical protein